MKLKGSIKIKYVLATNFLNIIISVTLLFLSQKDNSYILMAFAVDPVIYLLRVVITTFLIVIIGECKSKNKNNILITSLIINFTISFVLLVIVFIAAFLLTPNLGLDITPSYLH